MCAMEAVTFKKIILCEMNFKRDTSQKRCSRNKEFLGHNVQFFYGRSYGGPKVSRQFQFSHGNFNLFTAISQSLLVPEYYKLYLTLTWWPV